MSERKVVLITRAPSEHHVKTHQLIGQLKKDFEVRIGSPDDFMERSRLLEEVKDVFALVSFAADKVNREVIEKAQKLKVITNYGAGYNTVDVNYATERGIYVCNTPNVVNDATSNVAIYLILACCRRTTESEKFVRDGNWKGSPLDQERFLGIEPRGKVLGILGMGGIGQDVARKAQAFGMKVIYHNRNRVSEEIEKDTKSSYVSFDEILSQSDILSVHVPLSESTRHLIDKPQLDRMKKGSILVNTARGPIINEKALVASLSEGKFRAVGLDVFENEPQIEPELLKFENVTVLPHIGTCTVEARSQMWEVMIANVMKVLNNEAPLTPVNKIN